MKSHVIISASLNLKQNNATNVVINRVTDSLHLIKPYSLYSFHAYHISA